MTPTTQRDGLRQMMDDYRRQAMEEASLSTKYADIVVGEVLEALFEKMLAKAISNHDLMYLRKLFPKY